MEVREMRRSTLGSFRWRDFRPTKGIIYLLYGKLLDSLPSDYIEVIINNIIDGDFLNRVDFSDKVLELYFTNISGYEMYYKREHLRNILNTIVSDLSTIGDEIPAQLYYYLYQDMLNGTRVDNSLEILEAAYTNKINFHKKFNLKGYDKNISENLNKNRKKQEAKCTYFKDSSEYDILGGISIDSVRDENDGYEEVLRLEDVRRAVEKLRVLNDYFIDDYGINLIGLINKSLVGFPQAINRLRDTCEEFPREAELIKTILEHPDGVKSAFEKF